MRAVAIVNANARRLSGRLRRQLERAGSDAVRFTASLEEARVEIRRAVRRGVDLVALGGGDGTFVMGLALVAEACRGLGRREPAIAVLRLGSGNAIADVAGASDRIAEDLERLLRGAGTPQPLPLLHVLGLRVPFVGVGIDALLLEDHAAVNRVVDRLPIAGRLLGGATRYALSVTLRSMPNFVARPRPRSTVVNLGAPAIEMRKFGATGRERAAGQELWAGTSTLVAASTIPFFGFGLRMFAFAGARQGRFQVRCGDVGLPEMLRNTPAAFRGEYFSDRIRDFMCDRVQIDLDEEAAVEAGGELLGRKRSFEVAMAAPIMLMSLTPAVPK
jgi:diacylglycerol kinase family enzyme